MAPQKHFYCEIDSFGAQCIWWCRKIFFCRAMITFNILCIFLSANDFIKYDFTFFYHADKTNPYRNVTNNWRNYYYRRSIIVNTCKFFKAHFAKKKNLQNLKELDSFGILTNIFINLFIFLWVKQIVLRFLESIYENVKIYRLFKEKQNFEAFGFKPEVPNNKKMAYLNNFCIFTWNQSNICFSNNEVVLNLCILPTLYFVEKKSDIFPQFFNSKAWTTLYNVTENGLCSALMCRLTQKWIIAITAIPTPIFLNCQKREIWHNVKDK